MIPSALDKFIKHLVTKASSKFFHADGNATAAHSHRSFDSMSAILGWLLSATKTVFPEFDLKNKHALEIGTGTFFSHPIGLYLCGCSRVISIDSIRHMNLAAIKLSMQNDILARRFLSVMCSHDEYIARYKAVSDTDLELEKLDDIGITYRAPLDLSASTEYYRYFDYVFSYTVFEHVVPDEVKPLLARSIETLKIGGYCTHFIDLEDHLDAKNNPFSFLASDIEWNDDLCLSRGNRLRFSTWCDCLSSLDNMEWHFPYIAQRNDVKCPVEIDQRVKYTDKDDLSITAFVAVGRKIK